MGVCDYRPGTYCYVPSAEYVYTYVCTFAFHPVFSFYKVCLLPEPGAPCCCRGSVAFSPGVSKLRQDLLFNLKKSLRKGLSSGS